MRKKVYSHFFKSLGPGILFACIAVGGANFIQATHAGAEYGLKLIPLIILIYVLKYPFFEFAERYSVATKNTILEGYLKIGKWALLLYILLVGCIALPTIAALSLVDATITAYFLNTTISPLVLSLGISSLCALILLFGRYPCLENIVKLIIAVLIACSLVTFFIALPEGIKILQTPVKVSYFGDLTFLVALMGWMPAPIDVSVWISLWSKAKFRESKCLPTPRQSLLDFNLGYLISALLTVIFLSLGAFVMFASSKSFSRSGILFIEQLITLFTTHIGKWGETFIATIIFLVLISATLICLDAYPRAFTNALTLLKPKYKHQTDLIYWIAFLLLFFLSILLSGYFLKSMKELIDIATIFAFLTTPIFGFLNYRVITSDKMMPKEKVPSPRLLWLSRVGLLFLITISVLFIVFQLFPLKLSNSTFTV